MSTARRADLDRRWGAQRSFLMVPLDLLERLEPGTCFAYLQMLGRVRDRGHAFDVVDRVTGEATRLNLAAGEVFVSLKQIGEWRCSAHPKADHERLGRTAVQQLERAGFLVKRELAKRARRGYSRNIYSLPMWEAHRNGRLGLVTPDGVSGRGDGVEGGETVSSVSETEQDRQDSPGRSLNSDAARVEGADGLNTVLDSDQRSGTPVGWSRMAALTSVLEAGPEGRRELLQLEDNEWDVMRGASDVG